MTHLARVFDTLLKVLIGNSSKAQRHHCHGPQKHDERSRESLIGNAMGLLKHLCTRPCPVEQQKNSSRSCKSLLAAETNNFALQEPMAKHLASATWSSSKKCAKMSVGANLRLVSEQPCRTCIRRVHPKDMLIHCYSVLILV